MSNQNDELEDMYDFVEGLYGDEADRKIRETLKKMIIDLLFKNIMNSGRMSMEPHSYTSLIRLERTNFGHLVINDEGVYESLKYLDNRVKQLENYILK